MSIGSMSGGEALRQRLRDFAKKFKANTEVRVGFLEGSTYPDGTSVPMVAAIQNFGAPEASIPARAFFSDMVKEKSPEWGEKLAKLLELNDYDVQKSLSLMGKGIKGQLQQAIINTDSPQLSKITLMLRKMRSEDQGLVVTGKTVGEAARRVAEGESTAGVSTKVLDDTGHLIQSVDYEVKE
ncbi:MAG: hypothetical protein EPN62_00800 [Candidimonas sp.]|nr:MAG: hypothetical protein EPN77_01800 [Candidimonas sp.]TAM26869.1 MAG: hypothetical protein EPN62_00800 [Candidimonas sp.]